MLDADFYSLFLSPFFSQLLYFEDVTRESHMTVQRLKFKGHTPQWRLNWLCLCCICLRLSHVRRAGQSCTQPVVELIWEAEGLLQATRHITVPVVCSTVSPPLLPAVPSTNNCYLYHYPAAELFSPKLHFWLPHHFCVCVSAEAYVCQGSYVQLKLLLIIQYGKSEASCLHLSDEACGHK